MEVKDCSYDRDGTKPSPYWKERKYMNASLRAYRAAEILNKTVNLRHGASVVDMGSGYQQLKNFLPTRSHYVPVDIQDRIPGSSTVICNLNEKEFPFLDWTEIDAFLFLGTFEYLFDKISVLRLCRSRNAHVVMEYHFGRSESDLYIWVAPLRPNVLRHAAKGVGYSTEFIDPETLTEISDEVDLSSRDVVFAHMRPI